VHELGELQLHEIQLPCIRQRQILRWSGLVPWLGRGWGWRESRARLGGVAAYGTFVRLRVGRGITESAERLPFLSLVLLVWDK
jgi:hypothetical protein